MTTYQDNPLLSQGPTFMGQAILENVHMERTMAKNKELQVRPDFKWITDEARKEVNNWLKKTFGEEPLFLVVPDMRYSPTGRFGQPSPLSPDNPTLCRVIVTHPANVQLLKRALQDSTP